MKKNYLALGGLFACLHVLFLLASKIMMGSELLLVLVLPLLSTIYTLKCENKNIAIFIIATTLVCSLFDIVGTFIYVVPSLVCGVFYGVLRKKKFKELELLCVTSVMHSFSLHFSFFVIALLFKEIEFMDIFSSVFKLEGDRLVVVSLCFLLVLGFCEGFLVHVVSDNELAKLDSKVEKNECVPKWFMLGVLVSFIMYVALCFINNLYSIIALMFLMIFYIPYVVEGVMDYKYKISTTILVCVFSLISIFFIKYIEPINYLFIPIFISSPIVFNNFKDIKGKIFKKYYK